MKQTDHCVIFSSCPGIFPIYTNSLIQFLAQFKLLFFNLCHCCSTRQNSTATDILFATTDPTENNSIQIFCLPSVFRHFCFSVDSTVDIDCYLSQKNWSKVEFYINFQEMFVNRNHVLIMSRKTLRSCSRCDWWSQRQERHHWQHQLQIHSSSSIADFTFAEFESCQSCLLCILI